METCLINALTGQVESPLALPKSGSEKLATNTGRFGAGSRVCGIDPLGGGTRKIVCFETNSPTRRYRRLDRIGPDERPNGSLSDYGFFAGEDGGGDTVT